MHDEFELPDLPTQPLRVRRWLANALIVVSIVALIAVIIELTGQCL